MSKPKAITNLVTPRGFPESWVQEAYEMLDHLVGQYHEDLAEASICLAWKFGWVPDADGKLRGGQCQKASELHHQLHSYDFVILINKDLWCDREFTRDQRMALLDHELCHAAPVDDEDGDDVKRDENGHPLWRIRKHDLEEFTSIAERHGCWMHQIEAFAKALGEKRMQPLFESSDE